MAQQEALFPFAGAGKPTTKLMGTIVPAEMGDEAIHFKSLNTFAFPTGALPNTNPAVVLLIVVPLPTIIPSCSTLST